jgi:hypothetical protein
MRDYNEVHVIGHQTVADERKSPPPGVLSKKVEVSTAVGVGFKDDLARVAALGYVMRGVESDDAGYTSDKGLVRNGGKCLRQLAVCPRFLTA